MQTIAVVDYGMGNLRSVVNALEAVIGKDQRVVLSSDADGIMQADRVVFPGQGAAADCMRAIDEYGLRDTINSAAQNKPFLGICMGLQVLVSHSEENGGVDCLDLYKGQARFFGNTRTDHLGDKLKVPHMGWNSVTQTKAHPLWQGIEDASRFYFVHSYYLDVDDKSMIVGETEYGISFASAIAADNVFALQCHPEKSADAGLQLLSNFVDWDGQS